MCMTIITTSHALKEFCDRLSKAKMITVDTEFIRDKTYWPRLCLIQAADDEGPAAIDVLAENIDLTPFYDLLHDPDIIKVMHAGRQDIEIFYHATGKIPAPLFDTQIAAMVCGYGDQVGYETLVRSIANGQLDKTSRFTDWARRPLTDRQLKYALEDVTYLRDIYRHLRDELEASGRAHWLEEEISILTTPDTYENPPEEAWQRVKTRSDKPKFLVILKELAAWREREAQKRNVPRNRVLRDETLQEIANLSPNDPTELSRSRSVSKDMANGRLGKEILDCVDKALSTPKDQWPRKEKRKRLPDNIGPTVELLKVLLKKTCAEEKVAPKLVANTKDLEQIAADDDAKVPAMKGWRREVFGENALKLKHGKLSLALKKNKVVLVEQG